MSTKKQRQTANRAAKKNNETVEAAAKAAAAPKKTSTPETAGTRVRLKNESGNILMFTKKVGKNGAIRVSATISTKGQKPRKVGRETFTSHADANKGMEKMVAGAVEKGWAKIERKTGGYTPAKDKSIVIPSTDLSELDELEEVPDENLNEVAESMVENDLAN